MEIMYYILGSALILAVIIDLLWTTLWVDGGAGWFTDRLTTSIWKLMRRVDKQVFYIGDYEPTNIKIWANEIANEIGIRIPQIPHFLIKSAASFGDFLLKLNMHFPMTNFRLKNMTTKNVVNLENTQELAPNLPYARIEGIRNTLNWINLKK